MEHLSNDHEDHPNQHKNSHNLCDEMGHPVVNLMEVNGNWDNNMIRIFQWLESHCRTNPSITRKGYILNSRTIRMSGIRVGKLTIWVKSFKIIYKNHNTRSISSTRIGKPVLMVDVKVSKDKNISRWVDLENLIYVRWNRIKNLAQRWRKWLIEEKQVRHWVK